MLSDVGQLPSLSGEITPVTAFKVLILPVAVLTIVLFQITTTIITTTRTTVPVTPHYQGDALQDIGIISIDPNFTTR